MCKEQCLEELTSADSEVLANNVPSDASVAAADSSIALSTKSSFCELSTPVVDLAHASQQAVLDWITSITPSEHDWMPPAAAARAAASNAPTAIDASIFTVDDVDEILTDTSDGSLVSELECFESDEAGAAMTDDAMSQRIDDAMRGLGRLEQVGINPRELPTIRALFVRWTIAQWEKPCANLTPGIAAAQIHSTRQDEIAQQVWTELEEEKVHGPVAVCALQEAVDGPHVATACNVDTQSMSRRTRTRGIEKRNAGRGAVPLGHIQGPGSCIVKSRGPSSTKVWVSYTPESDATAHMLAAAMSSNDEQNFMSDFSDDNYHHPHR